MNNNIGGFWRWLFDFALFKERRVFSGNIVRSVGNRLRHYKVKATIDFCLEFVSMILFFGNGCYVKGFLGASPEVCSLSVLMRTPITVISRHT